jgi:hypothetical protein
VSIHESSRRLYRVQGASKPVTGISLEHCTRSLLLSFKGRAALVLTAPSKPDPNPLAWPGMRERCR